jgi:BirA family biotin operon repressor/biotin-[acetyl-CoA-carboxylase] ligase
MEFRTFEHDLVDSTSERAFAELAAGRARHGDLHVARGQHSGRGRRGAAWFSEPEAGMYASLVLCNPRVLEPAALTMGAGLAVRAALLELGLARVELKWPNDLLVGGAKLCGILAETRGLDPSAPHCVLGIGINVTQLDFPGELSAQRAVTSLALCGVRTTPRGVLACLLPHLGCEIERVESAPEETVRDYFAATGLAGRPVRVLAGEVEIEGAWSELSLSRGLGIRGADGSLQRVRLEHVRALRAAYE